MMPSPTRLMISWLDSRDMARALACAMTKFRSTNALALFRDNFFEPRIYWSERRYDRRKYRARIRGTILMAMSNKYGSIVLTTGNKSEMAVGYCTLWW